MRVRYTETPGLGIKGTGSVLVARSAVLVPGITDSQGWRMRVFLTGATGFIGSHVAEALVAGRHEVTCLVRRRSSRWRLSEVGGKLRYEIGDVEAPGKPASVLREHDAVIHLAAYGVSREQSEYTRALAVNVLGTAQLMIAAAEAGVKRFVLAGSCMEYGQRPRHRVQGSGFRELSPRTEVHTMSTVRCPRLDLQRFDGAAINEDQSLWPCHVYGATKAAATVVSIGVARQFGLPLIVLRPFHVFGPREDQRKFVPSLICQALEGKEIQMTGGEQVRDYCYVGDIAEAFVAAVEAGLGEPASEAGGSADDGLATVINLGTGSGRPLAEIARAVLRHVPEAGPLAVGSLPYRRGEVWHVVADVATARRLLGWQATTSLDEGIRRTIEWYRRWRQTMPQASAA